MRIGRKLKIKQIRKGIFETNSSSSHAVSVKHRDEMRVEFYLQPQEDGYIHIILDKFGWDYDGDLYGQERHLSYLLTLAAMSEDCTNYFDEQTNDWCRSRFEKTKIFKRIEESVVKVAKKFDIDIEGIYIDDFDGYIDHQSYYPPMEFLDTYGLSIKKFIFGSGINLIIDHDNH